jgi:hypothetical protein
MNFGIDNSSETYMIGMHLANNWRMLGPTFITAGYREMQKQKDECSQSRVEKKLSWSSSTAGTGIIEGLSRKKIWKKQAA